MLIASALWSTAHTIEAATLESLKSDLMTSSWQPSPAPASPTPLFPAVTVRVQPRRRARGVERGEASDAAGELRVADLGARVDDGDRRPGALADVPGLREPAARGPPLDHRAGGRVLRRLRRHERGVVGLEAQRRAALGRHGRHARIGPQPRRERVQRLGGPRAHRDEPDLRDAEAAGAGARGGGDGVHGRGARGGMARRGGGLERDEQPAGPVRDGRMGVGR
jgi:hypothetical protein